MTSPTSYHSLSAARQLHVEGRSDDANFSPATSAINVTDSNRFATANTRADSPVSMLSDQEVSMVWQHDAQPDAVMNPKTLGPHHEPQQAGWWSKLVADTWTLELVAGFISFAAISSIIGLLWGYDNKPVPPLMKGITVSCGQPHQDAISADIFDKAQCRHILPCHHIAYCDYALHWHSPVSGQMVVVQEGTFSSRPSEHRKCKSRTLWFTSAALPSTWRVSFSSDLACHC